MRTHRRPVRYTSTSIAAALLAAGLAATLTACGGDSGDDGPSGGSGGGGGGSAGGGSDELPALQGDPCDAQVELSGALEGSHDGEATVDVEGDSEVAPPATYQVSSDEGWVLTLASIGNGFDDPSVLLSSGQDSWAVPFGKGSVEVADDGSGAEVDAPAEVPFRGGEAVQVVASLSC